MNISQIKIYDGHMRDHMPVFYICRSGWTANRRLNRLTKLKMPWEFFEANTEKGERLYELSKKRNEH